MYPDFPVSLFFACLLLICCAHIYDSRYRYGTAAGYNEDVRRQVFALMLQADIACVLIDPRTGRLTCRDRRPGVFYFLNKVNTLTQLDGWVCNRDGRVGILQRLVENAAREGKSASCQVRIGKSMHLGTLEATALRSGGNDGAVLLLLRDVTEQCRREEDLRCERDAAKACNAAKGEFLAGMSHELKTPLNVILGFSEIMMGELFGPIGCAKYAEYIQSIHRSGTHLLDLIRDVLDMSRIEAGRYDLHPEPYVPAEAVAESLLLVQPLAERRGTVLSAHVDANAEGLQAVGDRRALKQILINLLGNAVKYCDDDAKIELRLSYDAARGLLHYAVKDNGPGIPPAVVAALGTPFVIHAENRDPIRHEGSTGLGLSIVKSLVELHGGGMHVNVDASGTTVHVIIPAQASATPHTKPLSETVDLRGAAA